MPKLRAALIALTVVVAGVAPAHAATQPSLTVERGRTQPVFSYADAVREHVYVESSVDSDSDGKPDRVRVDIIRPKESGPGLKVPVIIDESPYYDNSGRGNEAERKVYDAAGNVTKFPLYYDNYFVPRGYAVLNVDMIGTTRSDGCPDVGGQADVLGGKAVIDWLNGRATAYRPDGTPAVADWTTGKAAMIGKSYDGTLANAVAATGVRGLETIVPISAISSWYKYQRSNGVVYNYDYMSWLGTTSTATPPPSARPRGRAWTPRTATTPGTTTASGPSATTSRARWPTSPRCAPASSPCTRSTTSTSCPTTSPRGGRPWPTGTCPARSGSGSTSTWTPSTSRDAVTSGSTRCTAGSTTGCSACRTASCASPAPTCRAASTAGPPSVTGPPRSP